MKPFFPLFLIFLLGSCALLHTDKTPQTYRVPDQTELEYIVSVLAHDSLEGRLIASPGARKAARLISGKMKEYGLKPMGDKKTYYQNFPYEKLEFHKERRKKLRIDTIKTYGSNLVGLYSNKAKYTVIIGAHFDHIGRGEVGYGTFNTAPGEIFNGADQNASGVGAMLILARHADQLPKEYNYLFVAFSGEEVGFKGATYFVRHPPIPLKKIAFMINEDAVGRMRGNKLTVYGTGTSPIWKDIITPDNQFNLLIEEKKTGIGRSDHTLFFIVNIPALHLTTGKHFDTKRPTDDVVSINWDGIRIVIDYTKYILQQAAPFGKPLYSATNEYKLKYADKFKVTLGLMPDYYYRGMGLRIEVVIPGRTADKAGLRDGDIILQMGDIETTNIYRYVDALGKYRTGDQAKIKFKRGNKIKTTIAHF